MLKKMTKTPLTRLPDAILFDLDNTLYSYDQAHAEAQNHVKMKIVNTLSIEPAAFDKAYQEARQQIKARLDKTASSHSRLLYFQRMLEIMGLGSQVLLALDFEQTYWRTFLSKATLFDDVKDLLDDIRLLGIPTAIVTDLTTQIQFRKMVYFELDYYFEYIVTSEEAGFDKPNEVIFNLALDKIKPKGQSIWMIGDNPVNDILGSREAINAITFQKIHDGVKIGIDTCTPDVAFHHFSELRRLLVRLEMKIDSQIKEPA